MSTSYEQINKIYPSVAVARFLRRILCDGDQLEASQRSYKLLPRFAFAVS
jgi:hypothetical protein